jgi:hypothetical protein
LTPQKNQSAGGRHFLRVRALVVHHLGAAKLFIGLSQQVLHFGPDGRNGHLEVPS